jgi:DNA-binding NarL/FixJ family response regulator
VAGVRVIVAGRSALLRDLVRIVLERRGAVVVGEADTTTELAVLCQTARPDVLVSDIRLADHDLPVGLTDVLSTGARVLVLCADASGDSLVPVLVAGASGYLLLQDAGVRRVAEAVESVARGDAALHPAVAAAVLDQWRRLRAGARDDSARPAELTRRELEIMTAMADGLGTKAIARRLRLAAKTVESHKRRVFDKLGARNQAHAVSMAISGGLLPRSPADPLPPEVDGQPSDREPSGM